MGDARATIAFVCTGNAARSQMAEALMRHYHGQRFRALSAGTDPQGVHPMTVQAMAAMGIDISAHRSTHVDILRGKDLDYVITLCDSASASCPTLAARIARRHCPFPDPAAFQGARPEVLAAFCRVRDMLDEWIRRLPQELTPVGK